MLRVRPPSPTELRSLAADHHAAPLTYDFRGATVRGECPSGYHHLAESAPLGGGADVLRRAADAVRRWTPQRGAGLVVSEGASVVEPDAVVALAAPLPMAGWTIAVCRVVEVIDEENRFGFAYGTLPTHPESGEELFVVEQDDDGEVWFRIVAFSRPQQTLARLAGPVARALQQRATRQYLAAMQHAARP